MSKRNKIILSVFIVAIILGSIVLVIRRINQKLLGPIAINKTVAENHRDITGRQYTLNIKPINIEAPIVLNVDGSDKGEYISRLESGVAHMKGSALPGSPGNTVIFGHSSYFSWANGNYKKVFSQLDKLKRGDEVEIKSAQEDLSFNVLDTKVVKPNDTYVVNQDLSKHLLTLVTCWPAGTVENRLVVTAEEAE